MSNSPCGPPDESIIPITSNHTLASLLQRENVDGRVDGHRPGRPKKEGLKEKMVERKKEDGESRD